MMREDWIHSEERLEAWRYLFGVGTHRVQILIFQQGPNLTRKNHGSSGKRSDQQYCFADVVYYINIAISFYLNCNDYLVPESDIL